MRIPDLRVDFNLLAIRALNVKYKNVLILLPF